MVIVGTSLKDRVVGHLDGLFFCGVDFPNSPLTSTCFEYHQAFFSMCVHSLEVKPPIKIIVPFFWDDFSISYLKKSRLGENLFGFKGLTWTFRAWGCPHQTRVNP